jgi:hypothetical protein
MYAYWAPIESPIRAGITQPNRMIPLPTIRIVGDVTHDPKRSNKPGAADLLLVRKGVCDGDDTIGIGGMMHSEKEAKRDDRKQADREKIVPQ